MQFGRHTVTTSLSIPHRAHDNGTLYCQRRQFGRAQSDASSAALHDIEISAPDRHAFHLLPPAVGGRLLRRGAMATPERHPGEALTHAEVLENCVGVLFSRYRDDMAVAQSGHFYRRAFPHPRAAENSRSAQRRSSGRTSAWSPETSPDIWRCLGEPISANARRSRSTVEHYGGGRCSVQSSCSSIPTSKYPGSAPTTTSEWRRFPSASPIICRNGAQLGWQAGSVYDIGSDGDEAFSLKIAARSAARYPGQLEAAR